MICSFMDASGLASGPIKRCLFIGYIIISYIFCTKRFMNFILFSVKCINVFVDIFFLKKKLSRSMYVFTWI